MTEYIDREKAKLKSFLSRETKKITQEVKYYVGEKPFLRSYLDLINKCTSCLNSSIDSVLDEIDEYEDEVQISRTISQITSLVHLIIYLLTECLLDQDKIDREIYYIFEWFFEQCDYKEDKKVRYIVSLSSNIAMTEFQQILKTNRADIIYPALFEAFNDWRFYIIYITPYSGAHTNSLNWVIFYHECGHIVDDLHGKTHSFYPQLPRWWHLLEEQADLGINLAIEKRWAYEYTADYIATHIIGPCFIWRFIREYFELSRIFEITSSHPPINRRIGFLLEKIKETGFEEESNKGEKLLEGLEGLELENVSVSTINVQNREQIIGYYQTCLPTFTKGEFLSRLEEKYHMSRKALTNELKQKKSLILDPSTLYSLTIFDEEFERDEKIQILIADCIRLFIISEKFKAIPSILS